MEILFKNMFLMPLPSRLRMTSFTLYKNLSKNACRFKVLESLEDESLMTLKSDKAEIPTYEITELQCLYLHKVRECDCLAQKLSEQTEFNLPQTATQAVRNTNVIKPGMYRIASSTTQTRAPQLNQTSRNTNPRVSTSTGFLKDVNARTKKPNVVPINTRKPKSQANKSVATPHKKTVASESTITNSKSYYRMLYKKTNKAWKWWIAQQCPSAYTWVPKTKRKWVPKVRKRKIVQLILFIVDSGCTKHMTGNLSLLCNFVEKYLGKQDLLTGNVEPISNTISLQETTSSIPICLMAKHHPTQAMVMASKTFLIQLPTYINLLSKKDVSDWLQTGTIATACYTQNRSIIIPTHEKKAYHIINDRKPSIKHLYIFGCTCYLTRDGENLDKMKEKGDPCILVGYSTQSKGYRIYNKKTRLIVEPIHLRFDEIKEMFKTSVANDTSGLVPQRQKASYYDNPDPAPELQNVSPSADTTVQSQQELDLLFGLFNAGRTLSLDRLQSGNLLTKPLARTYSTKVVMEKQKGKKTNCNSQQSMTCSKGLCSGIVD
ncbi:retrovirus-related pol polyprotein from transposon TNT 1-94 [Tanacetum coccineum]